MDVILSAIVARMFQMQSIRFCIVNQIVDMVIVLHFVHSATSFQIRFGTLGTFTERINQLFRIALLGHVVRHRQMHQARRSSCCCCCTFLCFCFTSFFVGREQRNFRQTHQISILPGTALVVVIVVAAATVVFFFTTTGFGIVQMGMQMRCFYTTKTRFIRDAMIAIFIKAGRHEVICGILPMGRKAHLAATTALVRKRSRLSRRIKEDHIGTVFADHCQA
mmetsp:Transcript_23144/g.57068  ORF Transcript_23144/g.57068 Transcript_23144/m.57068 type:complete len:221 (+) Transcript_23144:3586-4248(+)